MNISHKYLMIMVAVVSVSYGTIATAQSSITFNPDPLFSNISFVPGDESEGTVVIENSTDISMDAYIEAINVENRDALADQMKLEIFDGSEQIYSDMFGTFISAGPVLLDHVGAGSKKTYNLKITFLPTAPDTLQGKTLEFVLCVGFSNESSHCVGDVVENLPGTTSSSGSRSGSSSSSGTRLSLNSTIIPVVTGPTVPGEIFNLQLPQDLSGSAVAVVSEDEALPVIVAERPLFDVLSEPISQERGNILPWIILLLVILLLLLIWYIREEIKKNHADRLKDKQATMHYNK